MYLAVVLTILLTATNLQKAFACGPGHDPREISKFVELSSYTTTATEGQFAMSANELSCTFDASQNCIWRNANNNDINWQRARLKQSFSKEQIRDFTGRTDIPDGDFLAIGAPNAIDASRQGTLVARLKCQKGNGKLSFDRWLSSDTTDFQVCTRSIDGGAVGNCVKVPRLGENPFSYNVPESDKPFEILLTAKGFTQPSFVAIDNISYNGDVCSGGESGDGGTGKPEACTFLNCDFEDQFCHYNSSGKGSKKGVWNRNKGNVGNAALGVRRAPNEYFANVGDSVPDKAASKNSDLSTVYVLESPKFILKQPSKLSFDLFQKAVGPRFEVCTGQGNCQAQQNTIKEEWSTHSVELPPGPQTIAFIARDLKINDFIAIDNIAVDGGGNDGCTRIGG